MSLRFRFFLSAATLFTVAVLDPADAHAQSPASELSQDDSRGVSVEQIEIELKRIASSQELDDTQKASLNEILGRAKEALGTAKADREEAKQFEKAAAGAADQTKTTSDQLEDKSFDEPEIAEDATVESLSQRLAAVKADQQVATTKQTKAADEPSRRRARLTKIPEQLGAAERDLAEVQTQLATPAPANESPIESASREALAKARIEALRAKIARLNQEQSAYLATSELLPLQQKLVDRQVERLGQESKMLAEALATKQAAEAKKTTEALQRATAQVPEPLRELAEKNVELAKTQSELIAESTKAEETRIAVVAAVEEVKNELKTSESRVKTVGLTDALGLMLRERRQDYDALRFQYRPIDRLKQQIQKYQIESFRLEDELDDIKQELSDTEPPGIEWDAEDIEWAKLSEPDARWVLLQKRQKLIDETLVTQERSFAKAFDQ